MPKLPALSENHQRAITISLAMLDERLLEFEQIAQGREERSVFIKEVNRLSVSQRKKLLAEIERMRGILRELKDALELETKVEDLAKRIWGSSTAFWEVLVETEAKYLRRYGDVPDWLGEYLDPKIEALIEGLSALSNIVSGKAAAEVESPSDKTRRSGGKK